MGRGVGGSGPKIWGLIALHDEHPGAFEASLIRAGVRWRDVGTPGFTWGDCLALIENLDWDDPLQRARKPKEWVWGDPLRDPIISLLDVLGHVNAKTPRPEGMPASRLPRRIDRPHAKTGPEKPQITGQARSTDEMDAWMRGRIAQA